MEHLSPFAAAFLEAEDSDRHVSLAVGGLAIIEGPMPDFDTIAALIAPRILAVPRLRQVLHTHLLDLGPPVWAEDPNLDLSRHIHLAALPHGGDDEALFRFVADVVARRLDRDRPLWECWVVEGLADGRWAVLMKIHHCIADGIATMRIFAGLSDEGAGETFASSIRAATKESSSGFDWTRIGLNPVGWASGMWHLAATTTRTATLAMGGAIELAAGLLNPAAESSLTGPVTTMRRFSAARVSLCDVRKVCDEFDVTLNDVALAAITHSFRTELARRGEKPRRTTLRTLVPVSIRGNDAFDVADNRVSAMLPFLPVDKEDPLEQLQVVHRRLMRTKVAGQREGGTWLVDLVNAAPFPLAAWTFRTLMKLPQRGVVTVATDVPGPRKHLRVMGQEVVRLLPIPPIALQLRTGIAILSYGDDLVFGITADYDTGRDIEEFARGIEDGVRRLVALSLQDAGKQKN
ncbi:wax ester/triacylglycerol synthase family O-acyltransferase [Mycobacterium sp. 141]|uniref:WS/DGAT/MGAT family O-acyltransferase n=1 Tax=Mycobacterium sp. 141 TaxID=1120797 RepID=UPI00037D9B1F|nr:wax ester/triacylglycerol synthase family O-acyltransferase [Mycobacterium sp. 141]